MAHELFPQRRIAAAFNAPIAAVTLTIEEVVGDLDQAVLAWIVVAAAIAAGIERAVLGEHPVFTISKHYGLEHFSSLLFYAVLGVAAAVISLVFTDSLLILRKRFQRMKLLPAWARPGVGGLVTGGLAVAAIYWLGTNGVTGGGYGTLSLALSGSLAFRALLVLCVFKLIATVFSYGSGGAGGIFAPALFIGGTLGGVFGYFDHSLFHHSGNELGSFALVGMGAVALASHGTGDFFGTEPGAGNGNIKDFAEWWAMCPVMWWFSWWMCP